MNYAVLGCGRMGSSLIRGMLCSGITSGDRITVTSKNPEEALVAASNLGAKSATTNAEAISEAGIVFLCVKPTQALGVIRDISSDLSDKLVISVVAGIRSSDIFHAAGGKARIIRSMPNTAVRLRKGVIAISPHASATPADLEISRRIFSSVGSVHEVNEEALDTVTAVSGSGPAFALLMLEALAQGAVDGGVSPELATTFAAGALSAASTLVTETGESPLALRAQITSPGGTTEAGLRVLDHADFSSVVRDAVQAARKRSIELSEKP